MTTSGGVEEQAQALIDRKRASEAIELLERERASRALSAKGTYLLGVSYFRAKAFGRAEATFREAIAQAPDNHFAVYYLGLSLERQGQQDAARKAFETSVKLEPGFTEALNKLGRTKRPAAAAPPPRTVKPITDFMIPDQDNLDDYIDRKTAKRRAEYLMDWRAAPLPAKIIQLGCLGIVLLFMLFMVVLIVQGPGGPPL